MHYCIARPKVPGNSPPLSPRHTYTHSGQDIYGKPFPEANGYRLLRASSTHCNHLGNTPSPHLQGCRLLTAPWGSHSPSASRIHPSSQVHWDPAASSQQATCPTCKLVPGRLAMESTDKPLQPAHLPGC